MIIIIIKLMIIPFISIVLFKKLKDAFYFKIKIIKTNTLRYESLQRSCADFTLHRRAAI